MLKGTPDDDEWKKYRYLLYYSLRLNNEIGFFQSAGDPRTFGSPNILDMYRSFRSPTALYSTIEKTVRLASQLTDPTETYKKNAGYAKKGDNKLWIDFLKLIGRTGNTDNPKQAIESLLRLTQ